MERPAARGLGIRERLEESRRERQSRREERESAVAPPAPAAAPVTVNVQAAPASAGTDVTALARMIVAAPRADRRRALEDACRALASGRTHDEALRAAEQLDEEIKRLDAAPTTALERARARAQGRHK